MKIEIYIPDELLLTMSKDEIKSKIEDFIKELSFEQKLKIVSNQLKSTFPDEKEYWQELEEARKEAWEIYKSSFWL